MTEATTTETPVAAKRGRAKAILQLINKKTGEVHDIIAKYPMPLRAPAIPVTINGQDSEFRQTTFGDIRYTYFSFNGVSFYVAGHLDAFADWDFTYPEGYNFVPTKLDRKAAAEAAAAAKKAKAGAADAGAESPAAAPETVETASATSEPAASAAPAPGKKGKKVAR